MNQDKNPEQKQSSDEKLLQRELGQLNGQIFMSDDFNDELDDFEAYNS